MATTKLEKIQDLLADVEIDFKKAVVRDILAELREFRKDCPKSEYDGYTAAIEVIESNF